MLMDLQRHEDDAEAHGDAAALEQLLADDFFAVAPNGEVEHKVSNHRRVGQARRDLAHGDVRATLIR